MKLHDLNAKKFNKIAGYALSGLASALLVFSAIMKFTQNDFLVESMSAIHLLPAMQWLGLIEIVVVILYWIPKTFKVGFFLLLSFTGGIIAAELIALEGAGLPIPGVPISAMLYLGTYLRKRSFFVI